MQAMKDVLSDLGGCDDRELSPPPAVGRAWQAASCFGNIALGAAQIVTGAGLTGEHVLLTFGNGVHDVTDGFTTWAQADDVRRRRDGHAGRTRQRLLYSLLAGSSMYMMVQAGVDIAQHHEQASPNDWATAATASAVALNTSLYGVISYRTHRNRRLRDGRHSAAEDDLKAHTGLDAVTAIGAFSGAVAQRYNIDIATIGVENLTAVVAGGYGVWRFWPSKARVDRGHGHGHGGH